MVYPRSGREAEQTLNHIIGKMKSAQTSGVALTLDETRLLLAWLKEAGLIQKDN